MPLYALDDRNHLIAADEAGPFCRYRCPECHSPVQKRSGRYRQPHFYHLRAVKQCRLYSRSIDHLIFQAAIQKMIPESIVEKPFPRILRIADLCWEEKKAIFEIQCSPIDVSQVQRRRHDYAEEGYDLIWLLDDRLYNRKSALRRAETQMRSQGGYYMSIQTLDVYDQFEVLQEQKRLVRGPHLSVNLSQPLPAFASAAPTLRQIDQRFCRYFFSGDLFDRIIRHPVYLQRLQEFEQNVLAKTPLQRGIQYCLKKYFYIGLEYLLRSVTK